MNIDDIDRKGLTFIRNHIRATGKQPSLRSIGSVVGYNSPRSVQLMLKRLAGKKLLIYKDGVVGVQDVGDTVLQTTDVPVMTLGKADPDGWLRVSTNIAVPGHEYFVIRSNGRMTLVRRQNYAENGDHVVVMLDNDTAIKEYHRHGAHIILRSTEPPVIVNDELMIYGVVITDLPDPFLDQPNTQNHG